MKRTLEKRDEGPRKRRKVQDHFESIEIKITKTENEIRQNERSITDLQSGKQYAEKTYLENVRDSYNELNSKLGDDRIIGYNEVYFEKYVKTFKSVVLSRIKTRVNQLKNEIKSKKNLIKKLEEKLMTVQKKYNYSECLICRDLFKSFERNCDCTDNTIVCLTCIKKLYQVEIKKARKSGNNTLSKVVVCPFCKQEMKNFRCPFCNNEKVDDCSWCKNYEELKQMKQNFFIS